MKEHQHLYLFILEIDPLSVGRNYSPLPSHLTLVSRFWSSASTDEISRAIAPIFEQTKKIKVVFGEPSLLGPKQTDTYLVNKSRDLKILHSKLVDCLNLLHVEYTCPQYINEGWTPHVSRRNNENFNVNEPFITTTAYLIEIGIQENRHIRHIRDRFDLST